MLGSSLHDKDNALPKWEGNAILLVDLDAFFASVEQLDHPEWRGLPVIVGGDADKRGVVATASYEARKFGVHSAMPSSQAKRLCPSAIWTPGHYGRYRELSDKVMGILRDETPLVQQVSIDEAFVDVSPTRVNREHPADIARRIQQRVLDEIGIGCSIGVGTTKTIAKVASEVEKPKGLTVVPPGSEASFLAPMDIGCMSGIGPRAQEYLKGHGIRTLGELARADEQMLKHVFGKNAGLMRQRSLGGEQSDVTTEKEVKSISHETSFSHDINTEEDVRAAVFSMASKVGRRLRMKGFKAGVVGVKVRYAGLQSRSAQKALESPTDDDLELRPELMELIHQLWQEGTDLRLIGVFTQNLIPADEFHESQMQEALFNFDELAADAPTEETASLNSLNTSEKRSGLLKATDAVRSKFGETSVRFGGEFRADNMTTGTNSKNPADCR